MIQLTGKPFFLIPLAVFFIVTSHVKAQEEFQPFLKTLEPYKRIGILNSWFLNEEGSDQGYENDELLIQFSFKKQIYKNLFFAYSHKSFWQIYDQNNSRPFRENDYNPEAFLEFEDFLRIDTLRLGLTEHESNGEKLHYDSEGNPVNNSRTWNRTYLYAMRDIGEIVRFGLKVWIVTDQDNDEYGSFREDNSDIQQYLGSGEIYLEMGRRPLYLALMLRRGWRDGTETFKIEGWIPLQYLFFDKDKGIDLYLQGFSGYGDSLLDYNRKIERFAIGFSFR